MAARLLRTITVLILVAIALGACTGAPAVQPTPQIVYVTPAPALVAPTPVPTPTPAPVTPAPATATSATADACGPATRDAVLADMGSSREASVTKEKFAEAWNASPFAVQDKYSRITGWIPLGEEGGFQAYGSDSLDPGPEYWFDVLQAPSGMLQGTALIADPLVKPTSVLGTNHPVITGMVMTTFASLLGPTGEGEGLLNGLGITLPLFSYDQLAGINTCLDYGVTGVSTGRMRLVEVAGEPGSTPLYYLYVRLNF